LLWTATTGAALAWLLAQQPPPAETIAFGSFLTSSGADVEVEMAKARQQIWRKWQNEYLVGLASAPIYGAALAGGVLAIWNAVALKFRFPVQPGHWLLVVIAMLALLWAGSPLLARLPLSADGCDFVLALLMGLAVLAATAMIRVNHWRLPLALGAAGLGALCLAIATSFASKSFEPSDLFGFGMFLIAVVPLAALISIYIDALTSEPRDVLHWTGVATLYGIVGHFAAVVIAGSF
jgi:hypothetical protein